MAQSYDAGEYARCRGVLVASAIMAMLIGLILILLRQPIGDLGFGLAGPSDEVTERGPDTWIFGLSGHLLFS